jgi:NADH-quinone oxidoreductase subunit F
VLSKRFKDPGGTWFEEYLNGGGYLGARKALTCMTPEQVIEHVSNARLRGLGERGFPPAKSGPSSPGKPQNRGIS